MVKIRLVESIDQLEMTVLVKQESIVAMQLESIDQLVMVVERIDQLVIVAAQMRLIEVAEAEAEMELVKDNLDPTK